MRHYEGLFFLDPVMDEQKLKETVKSIEDLIKQSKGTVEKIEEWGKKRLQYSIKGKKDALSYLLYFSIPQDVLAALRKVWQLKENILRFSIFKTGEQKNG
ncbi:MAG: 30S ribosomal protein S6 [Candidatus Ratteibacteria bacterium]|nr:30S ribosomal protein S6 [Candidatus Ratteibacteria bacterium]